MSWREDPVHPDDVDGCMLVMLLVVLIGSALGTADRWLPVARLWWGLHGVSVEVGE
jgi:hypothetical protein